MIRFVPPFAARLRPGRHVNEMAASAPVPTPDGIRRGQPPVPTSTLPLQASRTINVDARHTLPTTFRRDTLHQFDAQLKRFLAARRTPVASYYRSGYSRPAMAVFALPFEVGCRVPAPLINHILSTTLK